MGNTDRDSLLERWAEGMEKLEQYYENLYGPPAVPAKLPSVTDHNGMLEAIADGLERARININRHSTTYHNTDVAYTKTVPTGNVKTASIERIGGRTLVWNQLVDAGTTTVLTISGHIYYTLINGTASIITSDGTAITVVDDSADMVCDLTLMLGSGNEFATTDDFTEVFPASHYPYNEGSLLSAGVTDIISKDSNNNILQTVTVPAEIQSIEGYGWSAGSAYNYVDFARKVFVKNVDKVIITKDSAISAESYVGDFYRYYIDKNGMKRNYAHDPVVGYNEMMVSDYGIVRYDRKTDGNSVGVSGFGNVLTSWPGRNWLYMFAPQSTVAAFKTYLADHPITVFYELATPVEIDISEHLTDDTLINVEPGGSLTFQNQNGSDYCIPVPSTETFWVEI